MSNGAILAADNSSNAVCDKVYTFGKNGESAALSAGTLVFVDLTAADGITFKKATSTNIGMLMGILEEDVAAGAYTAKIVRRGVLNGFVLGAVGLAAGSTLKAVASQRYATLSNATYTPGDSFPQIVSLVAYTTTAEALKSVWINC